MQEEEILNNLLDSKFQKILNEKIFQFFPVRMERKTVQEESRDNETTTKASKRTSWKEVVCNGWSTQKETNLWKQN